MSIPEMPRLPQPPNRRGIEPSPGVLQAVGASVRVSAPALAPRCQLTGVISSLLIGETAPFQPVISGFSSQFALRPPEHPRPCCRYHVAPHGVIGVPRMGPPPDAPDPFAS